MKYFYSLLFFFSFCLTAESQHIFIDKSGKATFFSHAPLENIEAIHSSVNAMMNTLTNELVFIVAIRGFRFEKKLMQDHFNEKYMESDKYPNATFKCTLLDSIPWKIPGTYPVSAKGTMNLHGVDREITETGTLTIEDNKIRLESEFQIALKDYGISIPRLLFQNIADTILVKLESNFEPFKKK